MEIVVRADGAAVVREAAERVVAAAKDAVAERGRFTLALAGGSSPAALYELLASPAYLSRIDWPRTLIFFGDERCVPPEHEWSNYGMARRTLLDRVPLPPENIFPIRGENGPANAAAEYVEKLHAVFGQDESVPRFDLILLGMGDDGHTASLFPGMPALDERDAWVVGTSVPAYVKPQVPRVTLTLPVLNAARDVLFLVTGQGKAKRVREVRDEVADLPAVLVQPQDGRLAWLLDEAAGASLKQE